MANSNNISLSLDEQSALLHAINVVLDREDVADDFSVDELAALEAIRADIES